MTTGDPMTNPKDHVQFAAQGGLPSERRTLSATHRGARAAGARFPLRRPQGAPVYDGGQPGKAVEDGGFCPKVVQFLREHAGLHHEIWGGVGRLAYFQAKAGGRIPLKFQELFKSMAQWRIRTTE